MSVEKNAGQPANGSGVDNGSNGAQALFESALQSHAQNGGSTRTEAPRESGSAGVSYGNLTNGISANGLPSTFTSRLQASNGANHGLPTTGPVYPNGNGSPPPVAASPPADRFRALRDRSTRALMDATRSNPLVYYRGNETRFSIAQLGTEMMKKLLAGETLYRFDFERDCPEVTGVEIMTVVHPDDEEVIPKKRKGMPIAAPAPSSDSLFERLTSLRSKSYELREERGLNSLFVAVGMVSWPTNEVGRPPRAPLFLVPVQIGEDRRHRGALVVSRVPDGEIVLNRALMTVAPPAFTEALRRRFQDDTVDDVNAGYAAVELIVRDLPGFSLKPMCVLGIFNFALMAMVDDLNEAGDALEDHLVIRALAGDPQAQRSLHASRDGIIDVNDLDFIPPADEPFVLDADPWQARTIHTLLHYPDSHATIDGPPGTGKSQTIANLIASLIGQGRSVLFVCEKRAAIEVIKRRLGAVGLGHLLFDLHGAEVTRQSAYHQLRLSREQMSNAIEDIATHDAELEAAREKLNAHVRFLHTPIDSIGWTPYRLMGELAELPSVPVSVRLSQDQLAAIDQHLLSELEDDVREASRFPQVFLRSPEVPWSGANIDANAVPAAIDLLFNVRTALERMREILVRIGIPVRSREVMAAKIRTFQKVRAALTICGPGALEMNFAALQLALGTLASPFGKFLESMSGSRRTAMRQLREHISDVSNEELTLALSTLLELEEPWRSNARAVASLPAEVDVAAVKCLELVAAAEFTLGSLLPDDIDSASAWLMRCMNDRDAAYRSARMREVERKLIDNNLRSLLGVFASLSPEVWAPTVRYVWLQSHLEPLRPQLLSFDGRAHDDAVNEFAQLDLDLQTIARERIRRAAVERHQMLVTDYPEEQIMINLQFERMKPTKSVRTLYTEAPNAMLGLLPCVMASPLSVSEFLPRKTLFDVVIFDEASQVTPESAITTIFRGRQVVVAGDERQLPPNNFFQLADGRDDDEDDYGAVAGTESVLQALRPFAKDLGLRVHYRSRDERLIAFSNYHLYDERLMTFPSSGLDDSTLRFEYVDASGSEKEKDQQSSAAEVQRVVELVFDHIQKRPNESLGVIALGSAHARRIESVLNAARRKRPDIDAFFTSSTYEPFFVKTIEHVQGDERDAVILSIGYTRQKTGSISHNFGPINRVGGERRLNVAITRAKSRMTLVSSFRHSDLDQNALTTRGAQLLATYLAYAESGGNNLVRDEDDVVVTHDSFEVDIQRALRDRLETGVLRQYGVGRFRIDLAVLHPTEPGRFVTAVEIDGPNYRGTPTVRMRDRLRRRIFEALGWNVVRVWSTDWFNDRERELDRIEAEFRRALRKIEPVSTEVAPSTLGMRSGPSPVKPPYRSINDVTDGTLRELIDWIDSDGRVRTEDELIDEATRELGFRRKGVRIVERLTPLIVRARAASGSAPAGTS